MKFTKTLLISLLILLITVSCANAATINVGSGYSYSTIQSGMAAASSGDTVYVHAGTYTLTSPVALKSGVILRGDGYDSTIVTTNAKSEFASESEPAFFYGSSISNIEIYGFKFKGPASSTADIHDTGQTYYGGHDDYHNAIKLYGVTNARIHDCYCTLLLGDFCRVSGSSSYIYGYNCVLNTHGHDGYEIYNSKNVRIYNNYISSMINSGVRFSTCSGGNLTCIQNTFTNGYTNSGWAGVEIQGSTTGLTVEKNVFTRMTDNYPCVGYSSTGSGCTIKNNIGYSIPNSFLSNLGSASASNNSVYSTEYNWAAWGYGYNAVLTDGGGTPSPDPDPDPDPEPEPEPEPEPTGYNGVPALTLISPANGATVTPVNGRVSFSWAYVGSSNYQLQVATDSGFTNLVVDQTTASTALSVNVNNGTTYYWKARAYKDASSAWAGYTGSQTVTTAQTSIPKVVGVFGTVYTSSSKIPISGATVTMSNETWSESYVTKEDGYYEFSVLSTTGIYYITVQATDYISPMYQLPVDASDYIQKDIALAKSPSYFAPHNVKFVVTDKYLIHRYDGAEVKLYILQTSEAFLSDTTGVDGTVTFELDEKTKYRVDTVYNGITTSDYIIPSSSTYYIIIDKEDESLAGEQFYDNVTLNVTKNEINSTTASIDAAYLDTTNRTSTVRYILGYTEENGTFIELNNSGFMPGSNSTYSFTVDNYLGKDYVVKFVITHDKFGEVTKAFAVAFSGNTSPFSTYKELSYMGIFILFIVALQFGKAEHASGSILLCGIAWFMYYVGIFRPLGTIIEGMMFAGLVAATIYAIVSYINSVRENSY